MKNEKTAAAGFTQIEDKRRTGRSTRLMAFATALAEVHRDAQILVMAPHMEQLHRLQRLMSPWPASVRRTLATPSCLDLYRGRTFDFAFIDDADRIPDETLKTIDAVTQRHIFVVREAPQMDPPCVAG